MVTGPVERRIKISGEELRRLMRRHRVTIRELARRLETSQTRVREIRRSGLSGLAVLDWQQAVIGEFTPRLRAILRQYQREQEVQTLATLKDLDRLARHEERIRRHRAERSRMRAMEQ